ncbi:hypothetical protein [Streptomyces roseochromogenus]|nr:hypothetical protein [Streptomyces roseochromogenus]
MTVTSVPRPWFEQARTLEGTLHGDSRPTAAELRGSVRVLGR